MPTLGDIGEFEAIRRLTAARAGGSAAAAPTDRASSAADPARARVVLGSGDDAAVLRPAVGLDLVATTDSFVEGRHFTPDLFSPDEIGARLATANLSDLAAMAAEPRWALLSLGVRSDHDVGALLELQAGLEAACAAAGAVLVGGNLTAVEGREWMSLTLLGEAPPGRAWTRAGARAGDLLAVTGSPGRAAAGFLLARERAASLGEPQWAPLLEAWKRPRVRLDLALALAPLGAVSAAVDLSDGFAGDLGHLCQASGVGAEVDEASWPDDPLLRRAAETLGTPANALAWGPSDDYELLLAVTPARQAACAEVARARGVSLSWVGRLVEGSGIVRVAGDGSRTPLAAAGFDHFAGPGPRAR